MSSVGRAKKMNNGSVVRSSFEREKLGVRWGAVEWIGGVGMRHGSFFSLVHSLPDIELIYFPLTGSCN